jgi:NAD(P)-dependent dehydrogenase (short-subunit alcohol dehydrogenase family)
VTGPSDSFADRIALVTGGLGVLGSAIADALRSRGALVVTADRHGQDSAARADRQTLLGGTLQLDVTRRASIDELVHRIESELGSIDLLVNVAGVVSFGSAEALDETEWDRVIDINLKGSFLVSQAVIAGMKRGGFGRIVLIGSVVGKNAGNARPWIDSSEQQRAGNVAYGVSKAGVHAMTGFLAKELAAHGITVNAIAPGPVETPMTTHFPASLKALIPVGRMGSAADMAHAALFLASREAAFITGEVLDVNGGMWCD